MELGLDDDVKEIMIEVDLSTKKVTVRTGGKILSARITGDLPNITHVGYGGINFANRFTPAKLE